MHYSLHLPFCHGTARWRHYTTSCAYAYAQWRVVYASMYIYDLHVNIRAVGRAVTACRIQPQYFQLRITTCMFQVLGTFVKACRIYGRLSNQTGCDPGGGAKKRPRSGQEPSCTKSPFHQAARGEVLGTKDSAPTTPSVVSSVYLHIASRNIAGAFIVKQNKY
jgi:hypothetical protein